MAPMIVAAALLTLLSVVPLVTAHAAAHPAATRSDGSVAASQAQPPAVGTLQLSEELVGQGRIGGIAVDRRGFIYVANFREALWRIAPDGTVETLSRALQGPSGVAIDDDGNVLVANFFSHTISKLTPAGEVTMLVSRGPVAPVGLAIDEAGNLFVCNCGNDTIGKVAADGTMSTVASGELFACPNGITFDDRGNLYVVNFNNDHVVRVSPSGEASILATLPRHDGAAGAGGEAAQSGGNAHIAFAQGALFVTRIRANDIYRVGLDGEARRFAGTGELGFDDGPALSATLARPNGIAVGPDGATLWLNSLKGEWRGELPTSIVVRKLLLPAAPERAADPRDASEPTPGRGGVLLADHAFGLRRGIENVPFGHAPEENPHAE
jgi:DNA-binding beta-propeller fold protein YncE